MNYLALGDSISIDDYTGVVAGGAASQFARLLGAQQFQNLTRNGLTTAGALQSLAQVTLRPDVVTLTAGGNDLLQGAFQILNPPANSSLTWEEVAREPLDNLQRIAERLARFDCPVLINTIYDPTDGNDSLLTAFGVPPDLLAQARRTYDRTNQGIRDLARRCGFLLSDLEMLFRGHGAQSRQPWLVMQIEPNYAGATAIAKHWQELYQNRARGQG